MSFKFSRSFVPLFLLILEWPSSSQQDNSRRQEEKENRKDVPPTDSEGLWLTALNF